MSDFSAGEGGAGWLPFDLLGHPVPANKGAKGRPQHAPSPENLEKIILLYAAGHSDLECAAAIGITIPTMMTHYFSSPDLQRARRNARMVVEGELLLRLNRKSAEGSVSATEKLMKRIEKSRLGPVPQQAKPKKAKLGKKAQRVEDARYAGAGDEEWGSLLTPGAIAH